MLKLRLKRYGKKREPSYRIVVVESRSRRQGRPLQELGFYNPRTKETRLDTQDLLRWLRNGAQPTETLSAILRKAGIYDMLKAGVGLDGGEVAVVRIAAVEPPAPVETEEPATEEPEISTETAEISTEAETPTESESSPEAESISEPDPAEETPDSTETPEPTAEIATETPTAEAEPSPEPASEPAPEPAVESAVEPESEPEPTA